MQMCSLSNTFMCEEGTVASRKCKSCGKHFCERHMCENGLCEECERWAALRRMQGHMKKLEELEQKKSVHTQIFPEVVCRFSDKEGEWQYVLSTRVGR
ncbi:hypothetical protein EI42_04810 [Thermosporothrix hazakensis]|uniref:Uncharacterized protein n=1 Tax=Thermosporothrix hazakensis TaxID=644383 RepID=A0A326U0H4_THEHA|nr:hypothetical protein EI42_04810 [Thermosporothrix hazakensis]